MAENEYLDIGRSQRWRRLYEAVRDERSIGQIALLFEVSLRKAVKGLRKPVFPGGPPQVPLSEMLDAFDRGPQAVDRVVRRCRGHDYAILFRDASHGAMSRADAVRQFLWGICDRICDQVEHRMASPEGHRTIGGTRATLDQVKSELVPDIDRLAGQLVANPNSRLTRSSDRHATAVEPESLLKQSLLGIGDA